MAQSHSVSAFLRAVGSVISTVSGSVLILLGSLSLVMASANGPPAVFLSATGFIVGGGLLLAPISAWLRRRSGLFRPFVVPPLVAVAVILVSLVAAGVVRIASAPRGEDIQRGARLGANEEPTRGDILVEAEQLIARGTPGSTTAAMDLLDNRFGMRTINADPELRAVYDRASRASDAALFTERAEAYRERAAGPWLAEVTEISSEGTDDIAEVWRRARAMEEAARRVEDGEEFADHEGARLAREALLHALSARQEVVFPILRQSYGAILDRLMWERDVDVMVQGNGSRTIRFVAAMFAANRNIAASQRAAGPNLDKLRFSRSQYEWYAGSEATYYTLENPSDPVT